MLFFVQISEQEVTLDGSFDPLTLIGRLEDDDLWGGRAVGPTRW